jgi:serine/threonine protein kinase
MPAPTTTGEFLQLLPRSGLVTQERLDAYLKSLRSAKGVPDAPAKLAQAMVKDGLLTRFQADQLLLGRSRGYTLADKYRLLEHLGSGGMGAVYLCEHLTLRRRVALKVLPIARVKDGSYLERFYREARAVAALDHPNIVRAHDVDVHEGKLHFLVMEYVDGTSLQDLVTRHGPLDPPRAAHYLAQAALGLQHASENGLVHRDLKPGNILLDRGGTVKILDLGLSRFFHEEDNLSKRLDETVLGTSDYLAPEQTLDSNVDVRADIYSLGATFYFCLTGQTLFGKGTAAQKLIWHQIRQPRPIRQLRPEVPQELADLIEQKMLAKDPAKRFQRPIEIFEALAPWTQTPIPPPPSEEMPQLSPALARGDGRTGPSTPTPPGRGAPTPGKNWTVSGAAVVRATPSAAGSLDTVPTAIQSKSPAPAATGSSLSVVADVTSAPSSAARRHSGGRGLVWVVAALFVLGAVGVAGGWWAYQQYAKQDDAKPEAGPAPVARGQADERPKEQKMDPLRVVAAKPANPVTIKLEGKDRHVHTPSYEAVLGEDGNLTSLRVGGVELLKDAIPFGPNVSRGSYFFYTPPPPEPSQGVVKLANIAQPTPTTLEAVGNKFSVKYDFGPDAVTLTLHNNTDHKVPFFLIFDPATVSAVMNEQGDLAATPVAKPWPTTSWLAGRSKLTITGGTHVWGPFPGPGGYQVWEANLGDYETRTVVLTAATASDAEFQKAGRLLTDDGRRRVQKDAYEAVVEADGCLTSLRVDGVEFLRPGVDISRGIYFHQGQLVKLPDVTRPAEGTILAKGDKAAMRYDFGDDTITCTAQNLSDQPLVVFIVFERTVGAMVDGGGGWTKVPFERRPEAGPDKRFEKTTWFAGAARLQVTGGSSLWGPWPNPEGYQVWQATLAPKEERKVVLQAGTASAAEAAKVAEVTGRPVARSALRVESPMDYQVFQRKSRLDGHVMFRGRSHADCDRLEVRLTGQSLAGPLPDKWQPVPLAGKTQRFELKLPARAGGWYRAELKGYKGDKVVAQATVEHVGVGEVFVIAGQSNSTNCSPDRLKPESGKVASFDGETWRPADDPQLGVHDGSQGGSCWPPFGDALFDKFHVPVGIASAGHSGSSVNDWRPGSEYFKWLLTRVHQLGPQGFRAVLWHQGESDTEMPPDEYARKMTNLIQASHRLAGWDFPWFVARVSYHNPQNVMFARVRDGQKKLWDAKVALEGPDTDLLTGDNRDNNGQGIHFSAKGNRAHGRMWAEKVGAYLDRVLGE